jgi:hypothetical protein
MEQERPNIFVVGGGRNGTSMVAGLFRNSGYFQGQRLHRPTPGNPTGYFEDAGINQLNNAIQARYLPQRQTIDGLSYRSDSPGNGNGWLARLPLETRPEALPGEQAQIAGFLAQRPFCLKDTRFCYLLHLWQHHAVGPTRVICVFRPPQIAAASILKSLRTRAGLYDIALSVNQAFEIWTLMYRHVLEHQSKTGNWFFVSYEDVLTGAALPALADFSGAVLDAKFPRQALNRTADELRAPDAARAVHAELYARAARCLAV